MKKFLLLVIMVMLFVCAFAITASAADIPEWTEVITYDSISFKEGFDTTSRVLLANGDGTYSTYPANYIIKGTDTKFSVSNELDFTALKSASGNSTYSYASVIRFEMPVGYTTVEARAFKSDKGFSKLQTVKVCEGVTEMGINIFYDTTTVVEVELPSTLETIGDEFARNAKGLEKINIPKNLTSIPKNAFIYCSALKTVDFSKCEKLTSIGYYSFYQTTALESALIPEGVTHIDELAFKLSGVKKVSLPSTLETIYGQAFSSCKSLTQIDCKSKILGASMFADCTALVSVDLSSVETVGERAFYFTANSSISSLTTVIFSENLKSIGDYAFIRSALINLEIPSSLTTVGKGVFQECKSLVRVVFLGSTMGSDMFIKASNLCELVLTEKIATYGSSALNDVSTTFTAYYTGTDYARVKSLFNMSRFNHSNYSSYDDYLAGEHKQGNYMFIYGCNLCEVAYNNVHTIPGETYIFTSFIESACTKGICTKCGLTKEGATYDAIFEGFYYSTRESLMDGGCGIAFTYRINNEALDAYLKYNDEKSLNFGIFGAFQKNISSEDVVVNPLNADGSVKDGLNGVITADITSKSLSCIDFIIRGTEEQWIENNVVDEALYMIGYVTDGDTLYYMGSREENAYISENISDISTITYKEIGE